MFKLSEEFIDKYREKTPPFGMIGSVTYKRTYSRPVYEDGKMVNRESWVDTIRRVVEGNVNLGIEVGDPTATKEWAEESFEYMFKMGVMPPGRGYWMMGTEYATRRGGDAMNNCWYVSIKPQSYENMDMFKNTYIYSNPEKPMPSFPFVFMFDRAMLGGGVGFGANRKNLRQLPKVNSDLKLTIFLHPNHPDWERIKASEEYSRIKDCLTDDASLVQDLIDNGAEYLFPTDDREGWDVSVRETVDAHFANPKLTRGQEKMVIDLSAIRCYGALIKGFGGTASGPLPLISALVEINKILNARVGEKLKSADALDVMNLLGRCVVAGNVRRTALIALGDADDPEYVEAKNYTLVIPVMETDDNGYTIWEKNEWGRLTQRRKRFEVVVAEILAKKREIVAEGGLSLTSSNEEHLLREAEEEANQLFELAYKQENHRWASNNSVYTNELFKDHHFIAAGIIANGEPGVGNEWLMKNFGRIMDGFQEAIDAEAEGLNPCAEITLWNAEPCNLAEFVPYMCLKHGLDFKTALRIATQYTYRITFAKYMWPATQRVIANNRRIGVSLTGMQDYFLAKYGHYAVKGFENEDITKPIFHQEIVDELDEWYLYVVEVNEKHAKLLGAVVAKKKTTVKPSGTVAKLPGVSSGIHWNYSQYLIQRIRFHETDPNLKVMEAAGLPIERAAKEPNTMVVEFAVMNANAEHPNFLGAGDIPLEVQFANQYLFAYAWADNAVSATLTFKYDETDKIEPLLAAYNNKIKSTSLLPYSGHGYVQAPWEPISKEEYDRRISEMKMTIEEAYALIPLEIEAEEEIIDSDCASGACPAK
jgi:adenosylcobalamin-dependent ribonucleoside-triphosphate reductase